MNKKNLLNINIAIRYYAFTESENLPFGYCQNNLPRSLSSAHQIKLTSPIINTSNNLLIATRYYASTDSHSVQSIQL